VNTALAALRATKQRRVFNNKLLEARAAAGSNRTTAWPVACHLLPPTMPPTDASPLLPHSKCKLRLLRIARAGDTICSVPLLYDTPEVEQRCLRRSGCGRADQRVWCDGGRTSGSDAYRAAWQTSLGL